jgi:hypothetical protein
MPPDDGDIVAIPEVFIIATNGAQLERASVRRFNSPSLGEDRLPGTIWLPRPHARATHALASTNHNKPQIRCNAVSDFHTSSVRRAMLLLTPVLPGAIVEFPSCVADGNRPRLARREEPHLALLA